MTMKVTRALLPSLRNNTIKIRCPRRTKRHSKTFAVAMNAKANCKKSSSIFVIRISLRASEESCQRVFLLTGPPELVRLASQSSRGEADVPFFYRSGSEFEEMFVGARSKRVRQLFAAAKKKTPGIVFIDEIDAGNIAKVMGIAVWRA